MDSRRCLPALHAVLLRRELHRTIVGIVHEVTLSRRGGVDNEGY
jgi:hypothetical protein